MCGELWTEPRLRAWLLVWRSDSAIFSPIRKLFGQIVACNQNCLPDRGQQLFATCVPCHPSSCYNLESLPLCIPRDHLEETSWDVSSSRNLNSSHLPTMKGCQLFRVRALPIVWYLRNMRSKHCRLAVRSCLRKQKLGSQLVRPYEQKPGVRPSQTRLNKNWKLLCCQEGRQ